MRDFKCYNLNNSFGILVDINTSLRSNLENNLRFFSFRGHLVMFAFSFLPRLYIKYLIVHLCVYRWRNIVFKLRRWYKCKSTFFYTIPVERDLCPHIKCLTKILLTEKPNVVVIRKWNDRQIQIFSIWYCSIQLFSSQNFQSLSYLSLVCILIVLFGHWV